MCLYDSAFKSASTDTLEVIAQLIHTKKDSIQVQMMNVSHQTGTTDCALYAMAVITCLALDIDPLSVVLHKEELRPHLRTSFETGTISAFPIAKRRRPANRVTKVEICLVYCYCRLPDNGRRMVCCDLCEEWYHVDCARTHELGPENCWFCDHCKPTL